MTAPNSGQALTGDPQPSVVAHTPGPWELHHQSPDLMAGDCDWSLQTEAAGAFLLFCHHPDAPAKANARLIAAAPEMLAALKECADDLASTIEDAFNSVKRHPALLRQYERDMVPVNNARAAIAKATSAMPDRSEPTQSQEAR